MSSLQLIDSIRDAQYIDEGDFPRSGTANDKLRFLLNYAVLAPSGHNSQPWLFTIRNGTLAVYVDRTRSLAVVDPVDREMIISCGAVLFFLRVSMWHFGYRDEVQLFPDRLNSDLLARVRLGSEQKPTPEEEDLFYAIFKRRTNRKPFEDRPVPGELLAGLETAARSENTTFRVIGDEDLRNRVADLISFADHEQWSNPSFRRELASWVHISRGRSGDGMPGYSLGFGDLAAIAAPLVVRTFDMGNGTAARDRQLATGSPVLALLSTGDDTPRDWLATGQALARVLLQAASRYLSASFLNQPIELPVLRRKLASLVGIEGDPQILLRLGYGTQVGLTPRRPVHKVLR